MIIRLFLTFCIVLLSGPLSGAILPRADSVLGGQVVARVGDRDVVFPLLKTDIEGNVQGDLATITVRQVFTNPSDAPVTARYLFPLNTNAAVHAMEMRVGEDVIRAQIARRKEARETFETAKREGKAAALLEQHRPNMFTQEIANLMPGLPVTVTITYSQIVPRRDGAYELRVPLVVGPRYDPGHGHNAVAAGVKDDHIPRSTGQWTFDPTPAYPSTDKREIPPRIDAERVAISLTLASALPIEDIQSGTHAIAITGDRTHTSIALAKGRAIDNRDFVLRYRLAAAEPQAGVLVHREGGVDTFSLMIEPPAKAEPDAVVPREMVFVLDTSGSMNGMPMQASKIFMRRILTSLRPTDSFRIVSFSNEASEFSAGAVPATAESVSAGLSFVDGLTASGGTEILSGLRRVYRTPPPDGVLRIVVFLSDGYVGNEAEILNHVAREVENGRLYALGIGPSVNAYLIEEMARLGRGLSRIVDPTRGSDEIITFADRLKTPILTDLRLDWDGMSVTDVTPAPLPDLFEGDSIRIMGRFRGSGTVTVHGRSAGREMSLPLVVTSMEGNDAAGDAIPLVWARSRITDHMRELAVPPQLRRSGLDAKVLEQRITALGLEHSLVTQWTSFIAVKEKVVNLDPSSSTNADIPLPRIKGVSDGAYPRRPVIRAQNPSSGTTVAFSGGATPEPGQLAGLLLLLTMFAIALRRVAVHRRRYGKHRNARTWQDYSLHEANGRDGGFLLTRVRVSGGPSGQ